MRSLLEHPTLRQQVIPMTVEMYHALGDMGMLQQEVELLRGCILPKMSKSPRHYIVTQRLLDWIARWLPVGLLIRQEQPLTCADSEPEPDIAVVVGNREDYAKAHPATAELVVEVAIATVDRDIEKAGIYAEAKVKEYWLVLPEEKRVEVWSQPVDGLYSVCVRLGLEDTLVSGVLPGFEVNLSEVLS